MASFESHHKYGFAFLAGLVLFSLWPHFADAQQQPSGFAVERFYPSAPGAGWFVMDDLDMSGALGGAVSVRSGYAHNPIVVIAPDGKQRLALVTQEAVFDIGGAGTFYRLRGCFYSSAATP